MLGLHFLEGGFVDTARIAGVTNIDLVGHFLSGEFHLLCVDDDDIVAAINVWSVTRLVFAAQDFRYLRG